MYRSASMLLALAVSMSSFVAADAAPDKKSTSSAKAWAKQSGSAAKTSAKKPSVEAETTVNKSTSKLPESISLEEAAKLDPKFKALSEGIDHNNKGVVHGSKGEWEEAIKEHELAVQLEPENKYFKKNLSSAHLRYGDQIKKQGNREDAAQHYKKALEADPANEAAKLNLATLEDGSETKSQPMENKEAAGD